MGTYTLWCLNRVATWDLHALAEVLAVREFLASRHRIVLGDRTQFDRDPAQSKPGVLSHEERDVDEYFVPIAVKCIGDPARFRARFHDRMGDGGRERFDALIAGFGAYFADNAVNPWRRYWSADGREAMFTLPDGEDAYAGFYEIVARQADRDGKAVLVGYSQGGLVARFLAFLDEYLMERDRSVIGFVTVQAPNRGSPLANPVHGDTVARGLFGVFAAAFSFPIAPVGPNRRLGDALERLAAGTLQIPDGSGGFATSHFDVLTVARLLDTALSDARVAVDREAPGSGARRAAVERLEVVSTARKWLSGLSRGKVATAFQDLDTRAQDDPFAVLGLLADHPISRTLQGAVIGTDHGLTDFIASGRPWWVRLGLKTLPGKFGFSPMIRNAEQSYAQIAMNELESMKRPTGRHGILAEAFGRGCTIWGTDRRRIPIQPFAHDFVTPSASQALGPIDPHTGDTPGELFLGNLVNPGGTHISGGDASDLDSDRPFVDAMLGALGRRLR